MQENSRLGLVSICVPIYNPKPEYMAALLQSIAAQTYNNIELIISDDSDSKALVEEYWSGRFQMSYFSNTGKKGIFHNLNNAIANADGEYIQILCQDDIMKPDMIAAQVGTLAKYTQADFIYSQVEHIDGNGAIIVPNKQEGATCIPQQQLYDYLFAYGCMPGNLSTVMLKKKLIEKVGLFNPEQTFGADFEYWIRAAAFTGMAVNLTPYLLLRSHNDQASFTLSAHEYIRDIQQNLSYLLSKISFEKKQAIQYCNYLYNSSCIRRAIRGLIARKNGIKTVWLCNRFPFSWVQTLPFIIFKNKKVNLKQYVPFPIK